MMGCGGFSYDMNREISVVHKNDLGAYFGDWKNAMHFIYLPLARKNSVEAQRYHITKIPKPIESFSFNSTDLSLILAYLDDKLTVLEETPLTPSQFNYQAYAEARVFLKASYLFFRILLDDIAGIIEYFYKENEPNVYRGLKKGLNALLNKAKNGKLPEDLSKLLEQPIVWFPEMRKRRVDLEHHYESLLISFKQDEDGKNILGHFSTKGHTSRDYEDIRDYFGYLLCEYQAFVDNLLDHFDTKFREWYGIIQDKSGRTASIISGCTALPLWWAYKYGNYRHKDLQVSEG
jgi:hypothetical protein